MNLKEYLTGEIPKPTDKTFKKMTTWENTIKQLRGEIFNAVHKPLQLVDNNDQTTKDSWEPLSLNLVDKLQFLHPHSVKTSQYDIEKR